MTDSLSENRQVSLVRIRDRFSPDSHGDSHQIPTGDNVPASGFSPFSRCYRDILIRILTPVRPLKDGVNEKRRRRTP